MYEQHAGLIQHVLTREMNATGYHDRDEMVSVAHSTFMVAVEKWVPTKGEFSMWCGKCLHNNLRQAMMRTRPPIPEEDRPEVTAPKTHHPDRVLERKETLERLLALPGLAGAAVEAALIAGGEGMEILGSEGPRAMRASVRETLMRRLGATRAEVREAFAVVRKALEEVGL